MDKVYKQETPDLVSGKDFELRLYRKSKKLVISRPCWEDENGERHRGRSVMIDLSENIGDQDIINLLSEVVDILKG